MDYLSKGIDIWGIRYFVIGLGPEDYYVTEGADLRIRFCVENGLNMEDKWKGFNSDVFYKILPMLGKEYYAESRIELFPTKELAEDYIMSLAPSRYFPGRFIPRRGILWLNSKEEINREIKRVLRVNPLYKKRVEEFLLEEKAKMEEENPPESLETKLLALLCGKLDSIIERLPNKQEG